METLTTLGETANIAETLARELKRPELLLTEWQTAVGFIATPPGWNKELFDLEQYMELPRRKIAKINLTETESNNR